MNKILIGLLLLFISATGISQDAPTKKKKTSFRRQLKASTKVQINQLKEGALLVRLQTKRNSINALKKIGKNKLADDLEKKQAEYNLNIISAFRAKFIFCPVYFFFSDYSKNIREREFNQVVFLNDSLLADTTIKFDNKNFLTAEFGTIEQDTAKYFSYHSIEADPDKNWSVKKVSNYYGGPNMGFEALIIRNDKFIQLRHPFPYFVRTRAKMPKKRILNKTVKTMNKKLFKFYRQKNK